MFEVKSSPVSVNFNIDVNQMLKDIFKRSTNNDLLVVVENGTLRPATVHYSIGAGGHGTIASVRGDPDVSPIDTSQASETANFFAVGVEAVGEGSNILMQIALNERVLNLMVGCPTLFHSANYTKWTVTHSLHSPAAMRARLAPLDKHYSDNGNYEIEIGDMSVWVSMTSVSPANCQVQIRQHTDAIQYA